PTGLPSIHIWMLPFARCKATPAVATCQARVPSASAERSTTSSSYPPTTSEYRRSAFARARRYVTVRPDVMPAVGATPIGRMETDPPSREKTTDDDATTALAQQTE